MQGRNHIALALAGALVIGPPGPDVAAWGALVIGSLTPDLDGGGHIAYAGSSFLPRIVPYLVRKLVDFVGVTISRVVQRLLGHRGALHWPIWGVMLWLLGHNLGLAWVSWLGFGYAAHILGDMLTKSGVPIFGPISQADISLTPMKTGGAVESLFGLGLWAFVAWRLWPLLQAQGGMGFVWSLVKRFSILF